MEEKLRNRGGKTKKGKFNVMYAALQEHKRVCSSGEGSADPSGQKKGK